MESDELSKCRERAGEMLPRALETVNNPAGWSELTAGKAATTYKKRTEFGIDTVKIVGFLTFPSETVARYVYDN